MIKLRGNIHIELLIEMDKELSKDTQCLYYNSEIFCKYLTICSMKDFKPIRISEYNEKLKEIIVSNKRIMAH